MKWFSKMQFFKKNAKAYENAILGDQNFLGEFSRLQGVINKL